MAASAVPASPSGPDDAETFADGRFRQVLGRATVVRGTALGGGHFNSALLLELADGRRLVLKTAPPADSPALTHERGLLGTEALFHRLAAGARVCRPPTGPPRSPPCSVPSSPTRPGSASPCPLRPSSSANCPPASATGSRRSAAPPSSTSTPGGERRPPSVPERRSRRRGPGPGHRRLASERPHRRRTRLLRRPLGRTRRARPARRGRGRRRTAGRLPIGRRRPGRRRRRAGPARSLPGVPRAGVMRVESVPRAYGGEFAAWLDTWSADRVTEQLAVLDALAS